VRPDVWRRSLDDRLIDYDQGVNVDGYVWGVCWQELYPGASLVPDSVDAARWSASLGIPMYEAQFEANAHNFKLVFADLTVEVVEPGYTPFTVPPSGPEWKVPLR
jgi:hypothetical protein